MLVAVAPERRRWLRQHPVDVAIVILTPPFAPAVLQLFRATRLLRLVRVLRLLRLVRTATTLRRICSAEGVLFAGLLAGVLVIAGGAAFAEVESGQRLSAWDGIWWATTTVTTVGYGDVSPHTTAGRMIAIACRRDAD